MTSFTRLARLVIFLLSLTLIAFALPTPASSYSEEKTELLAPIASTNDVLTLLVDLEGKIKEPMRVMAEAKSYSEVRAQVDVVVTHLDACSDAVLAAGKDSKMDESTKAEIASRVAAIIYLIVQVCLEVSLKLGWFLVFGIFAKLDICLKLLVTNLGTCAEGLVVLIAKTVAANCTQLLVSLNFNQCMAALAITGL